MTARSSISFHFPRPLAGSFLVLAALVMMSPAARADGIADPCDAYARSYADAHLGSGDPTGDIVSGAMGGAVAGGAWEGPGGAQRGARVGGATAVLDNLSAYPGGWQAMYDMGYQICRTDLQNRSSTSAQGRCRSRASVDSGPSRETLSSRSGSISASSCR